MLTTSLLVGLLALGATAAPTPSDDLPPRNYGTPAPLKPFSFPLADGFPNIQPNTPALTQIQKLARGTLPNGALPPKIADTSAAVWQLIAFNEIFEVAYFSSLIDNITAKAPGYSVSGNDYAHGIVLESLKAVRAQEELHALGANGILKAAGRQTVGPCQYRFPVSNFNDAIVFASTFTDVVLGTLQEALSAFGLDGDAAFLGLVGSVIGQEGEQNGFYRAIGNPFRIPSSQPFLTASSGPFALSALMQLVVVPGTCTGASVPLPVFGALSVDTKNVTAKTTSVAFSFSNTGATYTTTDSLSVVYINGQNTPVVQKLQGVQVSGNKVSFTAPFPYDQFQMDGLTIAAVTKNAGPFANASAVAAAALYGPGLIEVA